MRLQGHRTHIHTRQAKTCRAAIDVAAHASVSSHFFFFFWSKQGPNRMISSVLVKKSILGRYQTTLFIVSFICISSSSSSLCSTKLLSLSVFFLCLLIFFVFSLFNFLVYVPYMTWSKLSTK